MKKKEKFTWEKELGGLKLRITETKAEIETLAKDIKWTFLIGTKPYLYLRNFYEGADWDILLLLSRSLYGTLLIFSDQEFMMDLNSFIIKSVERIENTAVPDLTEEEEKEILNQEKILCETQKS
jgi:hypothetical protein